MEKITSDDNILNRLHLALEAKGLKKWGRNTQISEITGYKSASVSEIMSGKTRMTDIFIKSVCQHFSINEDWLRTGNGEMLVIAPAVKEDTTEYQGKKRPMLNVAIRILTDKSEEELEATRAPAPG